MSSPSRKNAVRSATRAACLVLLVTRTIVYRPSAAAGHPRSCAVEIGSSPEHGSSSRMNSGFRARTRAMQSRCCCPPESFRADVSSRSLTSSQRPAFSRQSRTRSASPAFADAGLEPRPEGHVLEDRPRQGDGRREDHAELPPELGDVGLGPVDVLPVDLDDALGPGAPDEVVHPVEGAEERRLAAPGRPDDAQDLVPADVEGDPAEGPDRPEPVAEVPDVPRRS